MSEAPPPTPTTLPANLEALQRELEELFRRVKRSGPERDRSAEVQGPVLVIRGK